MNNLIKYETWKALNELRVLGMPYRIMSSEQGWEEIYREAIITTEGGIEREIAHLSFGLANTPTHDRWFALINVETSPISGWGSHQIMTVHQSDHLNRELALGALERHWETLQFKSSRRQKGTFPTTGFSSVNKNESLQETAYEEGRRKPTAEEIKMCKSPEGFNQINHCKALGLIPRADGTKKVSAKYGGDE